MEEQIKNGRGRPKKHNLPKFIKCTVTGKEIKVNPTLLTRKLEKTGKSIEEYIANFVCSEGKKNLRDGAVTHEGSKKSVKKLNPPVRPDFASDVYQSELRKNLIKDIWLKVCQNPPEYYQEKIKKSKIIENSFDKSK